MDIYNPVKSQIINYKRPLHQISFNVLNHKRKHEKKWLKMCNYVVMCSACLVDLTWMVCKMRGKWLNNYSFVGAACKSCSKQHITFLRSSYQVFSPWILLASTRWIYTVVLTEPQITFYLRWSISIWSIICQLQFTPSLCVHWHRFQSMRYCCRGMWTYLLISKACHLNRTIL